MIKKGPYKFDEFISKLNDLDEIYHHYSKKLTTNTYFIHKYCSLLCFISLIIVFLLNILLEVKTTINITIGLIIINIITFSLSMLIFYLPNYRKYNNYLEKYREMKNDYKNKSTDVNLEDIIDYIKVYGNKIVIEPLGNIDECYYYDPYFHTPLDDDTRQIFMLEVSHFWEEYYLTAKFSGKYELTYDEYKLLKSKDLENI